MLRRGNLMLFIMAVTLTIIGGIIYLYGVQEPNPVSNYIGALFTILGFLIGVLQLFFAMPLGSLHQPGRSSSIRRQQKTRTQPSPQQRSNNSVRPGTIAGLSFLASPLLCFLAGNTAQLGQYVVDCAIGALALSILLFVEAQLPPAGHVTRVIRNICFLPLTPMTLYIGVRLWGRPFYEQEAISTYNPNQGPLFLCLGIALGIYSAITMSDWR